MDRTAATIGILAACVLAALWGAASYEFSPTSERPSPAPVAAEVPRAPASAQSTPQPRAQAEPAVHEDEDRAMAVAQGSPEQRAWRMAWSAEREDPSWTQQVADELRQMAESLARGEVVLSGLSCRQTVCRMQLKFADQLDARLFIEAAHDPQLRHAYQSLDPAGGRDVAKSEYTYELLIKRPSADYSPQPGTPGGIPPAGGRLRVLAAAPTP